MESRSNYTSHKFLPRNRKEALLNQRAHSFWLTGLSGAGKSSVINEVEKLLYQDSCLVAVLDGDYIRNGLNNNLGFSLTDRHENIRRVAEVSKILNDNGVITLNGFISPTSESREMAKGIIGEQSFSLIYASASLEVCEKRDVKGLYKKARRGELKKFTGVSSLYEVPQKPDLVLDTENETLKDSAQRLFDFIKNIVVL
jgi:adenylyl-sulfate kinase